MRFDRPRLGAPSGLTHLWRSLHPVGRLALVGIVVAALVTAVFFAGAAGRGRAALEAERLAINLELAAVAALLVDLGSRTSLDPDEKAAVDGMFVRLLDDPTRTGAKLWALDGTIIHSDTGASDGTRFTPAAPWIRGAAEAGFATNDSEIDDPAGSGGSPYGDQVDLYVAVPHPDTGAPLAVVEVHESDRALSGADATGPDAWFVVGGAFFILIMSIVAFVASTARVFNGLPAAGGATAATAVTRESIEPVAPIAAVLAVAVRMAPIAAVPTLVERPDAELESEVLADALPIEPDVRLSRRQLEVLEAVCAGLTTKEIAGRLELAEGTVGVYIKELYKRLGVTSRAGAVAIALRRGLVR